MAIRTDQNLEPIPGYRLLERLGRGGFGEVWKAEAPGGLLKAIKFVYGEIGTNENGVAADQELKALSRVKSVRHPFILSLERYDIVDKQLVIVMELADRNLYDRFKECRSQGLPGIPRDELLRYLGEAAEALDLMNQEHQLQHLDIKPQNLFLVHNHIKVADFGLVKDMEGKTAAVTGGVTPLYAAPETFDDRVTRFCDQYSLAIVYQELLTGERPFAGNSVQQLVMQHLKGTPELSHLPAGDRPAIARALSKEPEDRYPCCTDMVRALQAGGRPGPAEVISEPASSADARVDTVRLRPTADPRRTARPHHALNPVELAPGSATGRSTQRPVAQEVQDTGVLVPGLVIGVGGMGLAVLRHFRAGLHAKLGAATLPHLRLLYLDTDPEGMGKATEPGPGEALAETEVLLTCLNRSSHYLKLRPFLAGLETWFDSQILHRIPRNCVTAGLRALGRVAFSDHYRAIAGRLRDELSACAKPEALKEAEQQTGLAVRSRQPRVYIAASLGGGTGGGMFLDLAYLVRHQLKQLACDHPEVIGLFLVPGAVRQPAAPLALGNAYAALTELHHFSSPETVFSACYYQSEAPLTDPEPPFQHCMLVEHGSKPDEFEQRTALLGSFLYGELVTALGARADARRPAAAGGLSCQAFGTQRLVWPRRSLVQRLAQRLCCRLVEHWTATDSAPVGAGARDWVDEQWDKRQMGPEALIAQLEAACREKLGQTPATAFASVSPLLQASATPDFDPRLAAEALARLNNLLGRPDDEAMSKQATLVETLDTAARSVAEKVEDALAALAVNPVEQPELRLAGAEEAVRQVSARLTEIVDTQTDLAVNLATQAAGLYQHIRTLLGAVQAPSFMRRVKPAAELLEVLRRYPQVRFEALMLQRAASIYRSVLGICPEYFRELGYCRGRLGELLRELQKPAAEAGPEFNLGPSRRVFPAGCRNLDDAVEKFLRGLTSRELLDFDRDVQKMIRKEYKALVHVCMSTGNVMKEMVPAMLQRAEAFVEECLALPTAAEIFLEQHGTDPAICQALGKVFEQARPAWAGAPAPELYLLGVPANPAADRLGELLVSVLPESEMVLTASTDDLVFYCERTDLALADLPQLGPEGCAAYREATAAHVTPHNRTDIPRWLPAGNGSP